MREFQNNTVATLAVVAVLGLFQHAATAQVRSSAEVLGSVVEPIGGLEGLGSASQSPPKPQYEPVMAYDADQYLVSHVPAPARYASSSGGSLRGDVRGNYEDGAAFGFQKGRLYHPLEGPSLNLNGRPTVDTNFGQGDDCDEWAGMCRGKDLDYGCSSGNCGGLKAKPGHLGIPWLRSKDNCDYTEPVLGRRQCKKCVECDSGCGCSSCGD
jgi:hypothetical protein